MMQNHTEKAPSREEAIDELLGLLQRTSTAEICGYVSALWMRQGKEVADDTGLSSPQRQTSYLLGLTMTTPEPEIEEPLPKASWERVLALLNTIADSYVHDNMKAVTVDGVDARKAHAASMAFIQRFMSGRLAVADQLEQLTRALQIPFDDHIRAVLCISATEALELVAWMMDVLLELAEQVFESAAAAKALQVETVEMLFSGPEPFDEKLRAWQATEEFRKAQEIAKSYFFGSRYFNCIPLARFVERFGQERTDAFLSAFALRRGSVTGFRYFASPNPPDPAELAPSFFVKDHEENELLSVPLHATFYNALYDRFDSILRADIAVKDRYLKKRSDYLEERANSLIASLFPDASVVLGKYFETSRHGNEHDGLILAGRSLLILEEKSAEMKTPSRDIERCFRNLTDQFKSKSGIQHAYNQANRVVSIVEGATSSVAFYGERGQVVAGD